MELTTVKKRRLARMRRRALEAILGFFLGSLALRKIKETVG